MYKIEISLLRTNYNRDLNIEVYTQYHFCFFSVSYKVGERPVGEG